MSKRKKTKNSETLLQSFADYFKLLLDVCVCVYVAAIICVMPFYFTDGYKRIGTNKAMFFREASLLAYKCIIPLALLWIVFTIAFYVHDKKDFRGLLVKVKEGMSPVDIFAFLYGVSVILAYVFSDYKDTAFWGAKGWYMGFAPKMFLLGIYFLVSRLDTGINVLKILIFPASAIVFLLGIINRFGIMPLDMKVESASFISTIGNMNWYCGYIVCTMFIGVALIWQWNSTEKRKKDIKEVLFKLAVVTYVLTAFMTMVTQGSSSGILALAAVFVLMIILSGRSLFSPEGVLKVFMLFGAGCTILLFVRRIPGVEINIQDGLIEILTNSLLPIVILILASGAYFLVKFLKKVDKYPARAIKTTAGIIALLVLVSVLVFAIMIVINTTHPGALGPLSDVGVFNFSDTWGSSRGATWKAGAMCFGEQNMLHKIFGTGSDCMSAFMYDRGSEGLRFLLAENFGSAKLTNAHNELLTILVSEGIIGFLSFGGMFLAGIISLLKSKSRYAVGCGLCLFAYVINNMFSFEQSMSVATIYIVFGLGIADSKFANKQHK